MSKIIRKISVFILAFILFTTNVFANFAIIETKKMEVTINGIDEEIEKIELYTYGNPVTFEEVFGGTFDTSIAEFIYPNSLYSRTEVEPFTKETFVENKNYDNTKYMVGVGYSYLYRFSSKTEDSYIEYGFNYKMSGLEELKAAIKDHKYVPTGDYNTMLDIDKFDNEWEEYINNSTITCERSITYTIEKFEFNKELSTDLIKDKTMKFSLDKFKTQEELPIKDGERAREAFLIRFYPKNGGKKDYIIGSNLITQDAHIQERPTVKYVTIDYTNDGEVTTIGSEETPTTDIKEEKRTFMDVLKDNLLNIVIAVIVTLVIELIIAVVMKLKAYGVITITNIITQLLLHIATIAIIASLGSAPMYFYFIAEALIVLVEFGAYALFIKDVSKKKLGLYSLLANACSFGLSLLIHYFM